MRKKGVIIGIIVAVLGVFALLVFSGVICLHKWSEATCTVPATCEKCGTTKGETIPHDWIEATCSAPKTCSVCKKTEGEPLPHAWVDATCVTPQTCSVCGKTTGDTLEHTLDSNGKCTMCGENIGIPLTMDNYAQYLKVGVCHPLDGTKYPELYTDIDNYMYWTDVQVSVYGGVVIYKQDRSYNFSNLVVKGVPMLSVPGWGTFSAKQLTVNGFESYPVISIENLSKKFDPTPYFVFRLDAEQVGSSPENYFQNSAKMYFAVTDISGLVKVSE
ncbi:hypothetical protein [Flintibacter sp. KGMB00164]|uniref:hypothetical protein n=1 Tax=Flintibacter sp. KGMB00164 TaxID=2610895 RepID=UPI001A9B6440|nr:hypothetical protein [Flintibacter sp. KGMB00164]